MPKDQDPSVIQLRGTAPYGRALDRVIKAVKAQSGVTIETRTALAEWCINVVAAQHGIMMPRRTNPIGRPRKTTA